MNPYQNNQFGAMDMLSVISLIIGYENLIENRSQSAQNDVNAANDRQAKQILGEINARLDRQDEMLGKILGVIERGKQRAGITPALCFFFPFQPNTGYTLTHSYYADALLASKVRFLPVSA